MIKTRGLLWKNISPVYRNVLPKQRVFRVKNEKINGRTCFHLDKKTWRKEVEMRSGREVEGCWNGKGKMEEDF